MPEVDERVATLVFDNSEFDPEVKKSQKTLEEFEKSLDPKAFDKYAKDLNSQDFKPLNNSLSALGNTFKSLETIATGALLNIGMKLENTLSSGIRKMTIDPMIQGWTAYADKVTSVQTIMAATRNKFEELGDAIEIGDIKIKGFTDSIGEFATKSELMSHQMDYVNDQLDQLMSFTDETSASYQVMVSNIGKFTSQSIDLQTSVKAMEGIATWANLSGANAEQMARAMYNISQSLGVGKMLTRDWMSIENANMATVEFKEAAIDAAVELGVLKRNAEGVAYTLDGKTKVAVNNFRDTLSGDWFTGDVMIKALDRYGSFSQEILKLASDTDQSVYDLMYNAINPVVEGTKTLEQAMDDLGLEGEDTLETLQKLTSSEYDLGRRAFEASYESKTLADAVSYVGDAIKTGWIKSYELIIGDYKEAKKLWTEVAEVLYSLFVSSGEVRNEILGVWKASGGRTDLVESLKNIRDFFKEISDVTKEIVGEIFPQFKDNDSTVNFFAKVLLTISRVIKTTTENLKNNPKVLNNIKKVVYTIVRVLKFAWGLIKGIITFFAPTIRWTKQLYESTKKLIAPLLNAANSAMDFAEGLNVIQAVFLTLGAVIALPIKLLQIFIDWLHNIGNMTLPQLGAAISQWWVNVWNTFKTFGTTFITLGKNVIDGFKQGISGGLNGLWKFITGIFIGLINIVKSILGIHSPSKVFEEVGKFIMSGLSMGISEGANIISDTITTISNDFDSKYPTSLDKWIFGLEQFGKVLEWLTGIAIKVTAAILIIRAVVKFITAVEGAMTSIVNAMKMWITAIPSIFQAISNFFNSAGNAMMTYAKQKFKGEIIRSVGQTALMIAGAVAILAGVFIALAKIPLDDVKQAAAIMGAVAGGLLIFITVMALLQKFLSTGEMTQSLSFGGKVGKMLSGGGQSFTKNSNTMAVGLASMAGGILTIALAISTVMFVFTAVAALMKAWNVNIKDMWALLGYITVVMLAIMAISLVFDKMAKSDKFNIDFKGSKELLKKMLSFIGVLKLYAMALSSLTKNLNKISEADKANGDESIWWQLTGLILSFVALVTYFAFLSAAMSRIKVDVKPFGALMSVILITLVSVIGLLALIQTVPDVGGAIQKFVSICDELVIAIGAVAVLSWFLSSIPHIGVGIAYFAAIVGILVGTFSILSVTMLLMEPAIKSMVAGINVFMSFLDDFSKNADKANESIGKFIIFSLGLLVASVLLSTAIITFAVTLAAVAIIVAVLGVAMFIGGLGLLAIAGSFVLAALAMKAGAEIFLGSYDRLKEAKAKLMELFTADFMPTIDILKAFSNALLLLGIAGIVGSLGLITLVGSFILISISLEHINKVMQFFTTISWEMVAGMAKLALGLFTLGLAIMIVAPGIATLALSILAVAGGVYILSAAFVLLGNNAEAVKAIIVALTEVVDKIALAMVKFSGGVLAVGAAFIVAGLGAIIMGLGLTVVAAATLALVVNALLAVGVLFLFNLLLNKIKEDNPELYDTIINVVSAIGQVIAVTANLIKLLSPLFEAVIPIAIEVITTTYKIIKTVIMAVFNFFKAKWEELKNFWNTYIQPAVDVITGFIDKIYQGIKNKVDKFTQAGKDIIAGLIDGMTNNKTVYGLFKALTGISDDMIAEFRKSIDAHSPSLLYAEAGEDMMEGVEQGVQERASSVYSQRAMQNSAKAQYEAYDKEIDSLLSNMPNKFKKMGDALKEKEIQAYTANGKQNLEDIEKRESTERDKTLGGALGNIWEDVKKIFKQVKEGDITLGDALKALLESLKTHGGTFLGDKLDSLKNLIFGEGGPLSGFSDLLKNPFGSFEDIFKSLNLEEITKGIGDIDLGGVSNNVPDMSGLGGAGVGAGQGRQEQFVFTQNNYSPKALSRLEIYRQTKRQFNEFRVREELAK